MKLNLLVILLIGLSSACATDSDRRREAESRKVKTLLYEYPDCDYMMVGMITTDVKRSESSAIQEAKEMAVDVGAEYLSIMSIAKYAMDATSVSGKGFNCRKSR